MQAGIDTKDEKRQKENELKNEAREADKAEKAAVLSRKKAEKLVEKVPYPSACPSVTARRDSSICRARTGEKGSGEG